MQDEILKQIEQHSNFINPYLKQFKQHLRGNDVLEINSQKGVYTNKLKEMGLNVTGVNHDDINNNKSYDGVVIINQLENFNEDKLRELVDTISNILKEEGVLFLVSNKKYYDKETIIFLMKTKYVLVEEFIGDTNWNFFLYKKNTIK